MSDRRRCLLVGDPDKGGFTVHMATVSKRKATKQFPLCRLIAKLPGWKYWIGYQYQRISACKYRTIGILVKTHISATLIYCTCNQQQLFCGELFLCTVDITMAQNHMQNPFRLLPRFSSKVTERKPRLETTTVLQQLTHLGHCADHLLFLTLQGKMCVEIFHFP